ncbi:sporulation integral membrane protein YlbJ [Selenomonadales bacterium OttesenSCG-928-I06]|nr:sporulation integral membrane protein YlbJ [Selenomonadales bacterium OttesenSCG-928-I06]
MHFFSKAKNYKSHFKTYFLAFFIVFIALSMITFPKESFNAAIQGLNLWWNVVFPALLPFFIVAKLLMGLGIAQFMGVLLEPLMRPVFNVPGIGAFGLCMGLASGYPMDAVITNQLRQEKLCSQVEAERLLAFTNTADPIFMIGAVSVGMFGMPELGIILALSHYIGSLIIGIIFRFYGRSRDVIKDDVKKHKNNIIIRAFKALYKARTADNRSLSVLLGDSVKSSMNTILLIGGFIIVFSVFIRILTVVGVTDILGGFFEIFLSAIGFSTTLSAAMVNGLLEIDLGALAATQAYAPTSEKVAIVSAIIAWSGLSVHGQVASIVIESGISMVPYVISRILHAILAAILSLLFLNYSPHFLKIISVPVMQNFSQPLSFTFWAHRFEQIGYLLLIFTALLITFGLIFHIGKSILIYVRK